MPDWDLIAKYLTGEATESEKDEVEEWLNASDANRSALRDMEKAVRPGHTHLPDFSRSMNSDWARIQEAIDATGKKHITLRPTNAWLLRIAASILLIAVAGVWAWLTFFNSKEIESVNSVKQISLADGSRVSLNKHAVLRIFNDFGEDDRRVELEGEAYFEIASNQRKPFIVTAGNTVIRVVGTAFNINGQEDRSVIVTVTEGKVSFNAKDGNSVLLLPGETGFYQHPAGIVNKMQNPDINFLSWKTGVIRFEAASLKDVCGALSRHYDATITLRNDELEAHSITTVLDNLDLDAALNVIAITLQLKIQKEDSTIYLTK